MKPYAMLVTDEIAVLTPEEVEAYSAEIGLAVLNNANMKLKMCKYLGKQEIERQIEVAKELQRRMGEPRRSFTSYTGPTGV
jgi:hypothetical protein